MPNIKLRYQQIKDAKTFYEILSNPNFTYFTKPKSLTAEKKWLAENPKKRKNNTEWNYSIIYNGKVAGAIGIRIDQHSKFIGEIGYFVHEKYWGKGIATKAVNLAEKIGFNKLGIKRMELVTRIENKASIKVAKKCRYKKEGLCRKIIEDGNKKLHDGYLFAKVI
jgi:[ribosomal protein S5]-alanine N-acetyltransferase